ncbi:MAG: extracellular solute-binding protein family 1 [Paenibacillus sp.]|jgi:multiple sugar transport system substrate-binding protein|nr:extracellular solute-binding protein family 1 [Paenibacillus sp.]
MQVNRFVSVAAAALVLVSAAAGCSGSGSDTGEKADSVSSPATQKQAEKPPEPVTLKFAISTTYMSDAEFEKFVKVPISQKFPYVTLQRIDVSQKGMTLPELVATKEFPDIYADGPMNLSYNYVPFGLDYNLDSLIASNKSDYTRFNQEIVHAIQITTFRKEQLGMPLYNQPWGLYYNKDLFDKMAVPYPKDGMTWDQVSDMGVKFRRDEGGISYHGLYTDNIFRGAYQLGLPWFDQATNKSQLGIPEWKSLFDYWVMINKKAPLPKGTNATTMFQNGQLAMTVGSATTLRNMRSIAGLNWDLVTYPQNPQAAGFGQRVDPFYMMITNTSKDKDTAFKVIDYIASKEVQTDLSRNGYMSVLADQTVLNELGKNYPELKDKNVTALTKLKLQKIQSFGGVSAFTFANDAFTSVMYDGKDANTALRQADELNNKALDDLKKQSGAK